jgi:hypothetical protein
MFQVRIFIENCIEALPWGLRLIDGALLHLPVLLTTNLDGPRYIGEGPDLHRRFCEKCDSYQPLLEHGPIADDRNPYPWYDLKCGTCYLIIATLQVVPDETPVGN